MSEWKTLIYALSLQNTEALEDKLAELNKQFNADSLVDLFLDKITNNLDCWYGFWCNIVDCFVWSDKTEGTMHDGKKKNLESHYVWAWWPDTTAPLTSFTGCMAKCNSKFDLKENIIITQTGTAQVQTEVDSRLARCVMMAGSTFRVLHVFLHWTSLEQTQLQKYWKADCCWSI